MATNSYFSGRVHTVVMANSSQDFYVLRVVLDASDDATAMFASSAVAVRGNYPGTKLEIGSWVGFEGRWETHPKYGRQIVISKAPVIRGGWTPEMALTMLAAQGVGQRVCDRLKEQFGANLVAELDQATDVSLGVIPGLTPYAAAHIVSRWTNIRAYFRTLEFLSEAQVPKSKIGEVWRVFGDDAAEVLSKNPWALVQIDGIKFEQADEVALRLGLDMSSALRVRGALLHVTRDRRGLGHLYLTSAEVLGAVRDLVPSSPTEEVARAINELARGGRLVVDRTTRSGTVAIYDPWLHRIEQECADLLVARSNTAHPDAVPVPVPGGNGLAQAIASIPTQPYWKALGAVGPRAEQVALDTPGDLEAIARAAVEDWSSTSHIQLSTAQRDGVLNALIKPVSILTGLPGTGKSTSLKAVVAILKDAGVSFLLCAPTGIAAKRMSALTGAPASTIHRAFGAKGWDKGNERASTYVGIVGESSDPTDNSDGSAEEWEFDSDHPHPAKVIVIDESSMVDQHLLYRVLNCTDPLARVVFVGDPAQLPSVGPGNVLRDMLTADLFPTVRLTEIFRQEETSDIILAAHAVFRGEVPVCGASKDSDFVFIDAQDEDQILSLVLKLSERLFAKRELFQVLSPRHAGTLGVTNLNNRLRDLINPPASGLGEMRLGSETVREDDRVMVVKNNYEKGPIFNGDTGKIAKLDRKADEVEIKIHGPPVLHVRLSFKEAPKHLRLAYAVTVHKMQGQEQDIIIMPLIRGFGFQLQRNLLYTGITRARQRVYLIGHRDALARAVANDREDIRNTLFPDRLRRAAAQWVCS